MADKEFLRTRNLDIIKCAKKHLDRPKKWRDLFFLPPYERAVIMRGLDTIEANYNDENLIIQENKKIYEWVKELTKDNVEKEQPRKDESVPGWRAAHPSCPGDCNTMSEDDCWCVVPVEDGLKIFDAYKRSGDGYNVYSPSPNAVFTGHYNECIKYIQGVSNGQ